MNKFCHQIVFIFIIILTLNSVFAQDPTFDITIRNIKTTNASGQQTGDTLTFEVWLRWTNYGSSNRFEFAAGQYTWTCNRAVMGTANQGLNFVRTTAGPGFNFYLPPMQGQVDSLTAPPGLLYLKLAGNGTTSELPPYIVSADAPYGARIFSARLVNQGGVNFPVVPFNLRFKLGAAPNSFIYYFLPVTVPDTEYAPPQLAVSLMDTVINHYKVENPDILIGSHIRVNLTALFEGRYNSTLNLMTKRDSVKVYLRNAASPFQIMDSARGAIDSVNFSNIFSFLKAPSGYYYIVIKHNQCIETWSKAGGEYLTNDYSIYNYDLTSASSQAYLDNLKLKGSKYCLYGGDVDQNGFINLTDALSIYNGAYNFVYGNDINDLTGDGFVDLHDMLIASSNKNSFIRVRTP